MAVKAIKHESVTVTQEVRVFPFAVDDERTPTPNGPFWTIDCPIDPPRAPVIRLTNVFRFKRSDWEKFKVAVDEGFTLFETSFPRAR